MNATLLSLATIIAGIFILQGANGLFASFLTVRMAHEGFSTSTIGLIATGYPVGFMVSCFLAPKLIRAVGHIRAFAALAAVLSCLTLVFAAWIDARFWFGLRVATGFTAAGLFMIGESWLSDKTPGHIRGKVFAVYTISNMTAVGSAQWMLDFVSVETTALFMVAAGLFTASLVPVALSTHSAPQHRAAAALPVLQLWRLSPLGIVGATASGLINTAFAGLAPLYGLKVGMSPGEVGHFMSAVFFGALFLQWPLGRLSDRIDRRRVIAGVLLAIGILATLIAFFGHQSRPLLIGLGMIYGGFAYTVYSLSLGHANDFASQEQRVAVSAGMLLCWASGSIAGPTLAGFLFEAVGPTGLFLYTGGIAGLVFLFALWRMTRRPSPALQGAFVAKMPTTPVAAELDPRTGDP